MLFNSIEFAIFLPIVFLLYWYAVKGSIKQQNWLLLLSSYFFYGWWDWRFLALIIFSSLVDYSVGLKMAKTGSGSIKKALLVTSILVNLSFLGFFKYFNFFLDSFRDAYTLFGSSLDVRPLSIVLPVGISFYTFQTLSYSIDIYREKLKPTEDIVSFFAFVSFFPQLVAGPIERAKNLLPQFHMARSFDHQKAVDGMRQILWGLFKKVVVADNCAYFVNQVFAGHEEYNASTLVLGAVLFAFQIYGDFSGYSDIAIGTARLFGFNLMRNFAYPYFSRDIAEFWRRWHISLSTWFRDYVYIPLGGSRGSLQQKIRNTFIIFVVSGFWHGANWTFVVWGALNAIYFLPLLLRDKNRKHLEAIDNKYLPSFTQFIQMAGTFMLTTLAWVFFRAESVSDAMLYLQGIFDASIFEQPEILQASLKYTLIAVAALIMVEWIHRHRQHGLEFGEKQMARPIRWAIYAVLVISIISFGGGQQDFIYFQF